MSIRNSFLFKIVLLANAFMAFSRPASATVLTSYINVDNGFVAYVSTSDNTTGTAFSSGNNWGVATSGTFTLTAGVDYYLHIYAYDGGGIAGALGRFTLSGTDHVFSNASTTLLTETTDWKGNSTGFNGVYGSLTDLGANGVGPWNFQSTVGSGAHWIWVGDADANDYSYLTTKITATSHAAPEPASLALAGMGLAALGLRRRRRD